MDLHQEISKIKKDHIPDERIQKRVEFEDKTRKAILASLDSFSYNSFNSIMDLMNTDIWKEKENVDRFYPLFGTPQKNMIKKAKKSPQD